MGTATKLLCFSLALLGALLQARGISRPTAVRLENNEYTNVLVAVHQDVAEDSTIIDKIKAMFTDASSYMYTGTRKRAFFKEVKILIPSTWTDDPAYTSASSEIYANADVIIAEMTPRYRDRPYSRTFGGCGKQGIRIHLTPKFLTDPRSRRAYGPPGRVLVHEWGHFRWGVFDEYPVEGEQEFYFSPTTGKYEVVRCNIHMYGQIAMMDDHNRPLRPFQFCRETDLDKVTGRFPDACHFHVMTRGQKTKNITASIMDRQEVDSIVNFCDDDQSDQKKVHNYEAPNRQNRMCGQRSTWAVITESEDFRAGRNPPRDVSDTAPTFSLLKASRTRRVTFVLDSSGSMLIDRKLTRMRQTVSNFINDGLHDDTELGMVSFSSSAHVLYPMSRVNSTSVKHALLRDLPKLAEGGTSIGSGMQKALELIRSNERNSSGAVMLILTDGQETQPPFINDVLPKVKDAGVIVNILSFSPDPADDLAQASSETGGRFYFDSNQDESTALEDAFFDISDALSSQSVSNAMQLMSKADGLLPGKYLQGSVSIDSSVGRNTQFLMTFEKCEPTLRLTSPTGRIYNKFYPEYSSDVNLKTARIRIPGIAEQGIWHFRIKNGCEQFQKVLFMVSSHVINPTESSIRVEAVVSPLNVGWSPEMTIYAEVTQQGHPVTGLSVKAVVDRPFADPSEMSLLDNGAGADMTKNDGVYSRFFTKYTGNGRYSVRIEVTGQGVVKRFTTRDGSGSINVFPAAHFRTPFAFVPLTSPINRVTTGGVFSFRHPNTSASLGPFSDDVLLVDELAPGRVIDLKVMQTRHEDNTVVLVWTAPGDDFDHDTASRYEIKMASTAADLLANISRTRYITQDDVIRGDLQSPLPAGSKETFTLKLKRAPNSNASFVFTIRAIDDVGHKGEFSNFATAGFGFVPDYTDPEYSEMVEHPRTTAETVSHRQKVIIAGVVGSFTGLLVIVIVISLILHVCARNIPNNKKQLSFTV